jgi:hypothetical protein
MALLGTEEILPLCNIYLTEGKLSYDCLYQDIPSCNNFPSMYISLKGMGSSVEHAVPDRMRLKYTCTLSQSSFAPLVDYL